MRASTAASSPPSHEMTSPRYGKWSTTGMKPELGSKIGDKSVPSRVVGSEYMWSGFESRAARRDSVVADGHRTATEAAGLKDRGSIATDL